MPLLLLKKKTMPKTINKTTINAQTKVFINILLSYMVYIIMRPSMIINSKNRQNGGIALTFLSVVCGITHKTLILIISAHIARHTVYCWICFANPFAVYAFYGCDGARFCNRHRSQKYYIL